ncbi:MAG: hypothetical protein AB7S38_24550 [Vulcanimicrobiota bacterium]
MRIQTALRGQSIPRSNQKPVAPSPAPDCFTPSEVTLPLLDPKLFSPPDHYRPGAPSRTRVHELDEPGQRLHLMGRVVDPAGYGVYDADVEVWMADASGRYGDGPEFHGRGQQITDPSGSFHFHSVKPGRAEGPPCIYLRIKAQDYETRTVRLLFANEEDNPPGADPPPVELFAVGEGEDRFWLAETEVVLTPRRRG